MYVFEVHERAQEINQNIITLIDDVYDNIINNPDKTINDKWHSWYLISDYLQDAVFTLDLHVDYSVLGYAPNSYVSLSGLVAMIEEDDIEGNMNPNWLDHLKLNIMDSRRKGFVYRELGESANTRNW